jgi:ceramide glucosyltransferase
MNELIPFAQSLFIGAAALHFGSVVAVLIRLRRNAATPPRWFDAGGVSILRPVCGLENHVEETLRSSFQLEYPDTEVLFCVAREDDPVVPVVRELIASHPHVDARLLIGQSDVSANPKLNNLVKGWHAAQHDWILMVDSNVLMPADHIERMLAVWSAGTGVVCSPPAGVAPANFWAELECAFLNTYQARWQCLADSAGFGFTQGKAMLWRRELLERIGGIEALGCEAAEDAAATKIIRGLGLKVRLVVAPFFQPLGERRLADVWKRQVRWARLRRGTFKVCFAPELFAGGLVPLAACALAVAAGAFPVEFLLLAIAGWYGTEAALAFAAGWPLTLRTIAAAMARDALLPLLWLSAWTGDDFEWRGNAMTLAEETLAEDGRPS